MMASALKNNPVDACIRNVPCNVPFKFNHTLSPTLSATSQGRTGRCWLFSGLTTLRYLAKSEEEFSYVYLFYHDKVERYRQTLFTLGDETVSPSHRSIIFKEAMSDGGQWDLFVSLVKRIGVMPKAAMPETFHANASKGLCRAADELLRVHAEKIMTVSKEKRPDLIHDLVNTEASSLFADLLGVPPDTFVDAVNDAERQPDKFFRELNVDLDQYVSVVHDPRLDGVADSMWHELQYVYDCDCKRVGWLSVSLERMEKLAVLTITQEKMPVWIGANTDGLDRESGIHDPAICKYGDVWPMMGSVNKRFALETFLRVPGHAMVVTGVHMHTELNVPVRWQVDNSWGRTGIHDGKHIMTTLGFREFVFQCVVPKKLLTRTELSVVHDSERTVLVPPDDPLATLARLL